MKMVLASASQFRKRAVDMLGVLYEICPSRIDEKAIRDNDPASLTRQLAEEKARSVASEHPDAVVVSGDAVVSKAGRIYEKPRNLAEAAQFLRELSGGEFQSVSNALADPKNAVHGRSLRQLLSSAGGARNPVVHRKVFPY